MSIGSLNRLGGLILAERDALMAEWRSQVRALPAAANLDRPTLDDHIPQFLEELAEALQSSVEVSIAEAVVDSTPPAHGLQRLEDGFDIEEVVAEYNILRGCIHDLAEEHRVEIRGT